MAGENPIKRLVPIYVFPKMKLPKQNYYVLSPNFHIHICEQFICSQDQYANFAAAKLAY